MAHRYGEIPERSKGADCKSVGSAFQGSNPCLPIFISKKIKANIPAEVRRFSFLIDFPLFTDDKNVSPLDLKS